MRNSETLAQRYLNEAEIALSARVSTKEKGEIRLAEAEAIRDRIEVGINRDLASIDDYAVESLSRTKRHDRIGAEMVSLRARVEIGRELIEVLDALEARARGSIPENGVTMECPTMPHEYRDFGPSLGTWMEPPPPHAPEFEAQSVNRNGASR